ncbi:MULTISPECIES: AAA family ATPase [unclassified Brenneria]|uniref:AAA family ATPase n=1 Tax=unclassified Brenneria TaxID=2634434 RepID=UPI0015536519|nr:AAA family ATPase [Brenneria sp. hezel4-2-4]MEE3649762.1 AAA family ATPase [Brenneria sp. HEZEL_4_2_4]NPC99721.1 AAA family ATPase [Brenneria sp. hezel4-2-4]
MPKQSAAPVGVPGKRVVMVNGVPASGKSSIAIALATATGWPVLSLDGVKNPFLQHLDGVDRKFNRLLGMASYQAIWSIVASAPVGNTFIIDAWFGFQPKASLKAYLAESGVTQLAEVWCQISGELAAQRYESRLGQRLPGHPGADYIPELIELARVAEPMKLGPLFIVDQTLPVDIEKITAWMQEVLSE